MKNYVSIDIGGTAIKYGVIDGSGHILSKREKKTEAWKGGPSILDKASGIVEEYVNQEEISQEYMITLVQETDKYYVKDIDTKIY